MGEPAVDSAIGGGPPRGTRTAANTAAPPERGATNARAGGRVASAPPFPGRWRLLVSPAHSGAENMAIDQALMGRARATGECVLRIYAWRRPTLSFGRNQPARGEYDAARARALGIDVVRRPTGGRAVLHWREVTYSVTAAATVLGELRHSYLVINRLLLDALRLLGADATMESSTDPAPTPGLAPCFETPVSGEIVALGRKLVGSAQWRDRGALLQHGSILVDDDQSLATELLTRPAAPAPPPATLRALLGRAPSLPEVADALRRALSGAGASVASLLDYDAPLREAAGRLLYKYRGDDWTWRR